MILDMEKIMESCRNRSLMSLVCAIVAVSPLSVWAADDAAPTAAESVPHSAYVKPNITHEPYGEVKMVVALTSDDKGIQGMKLRNIANSLNAADEWQGRFTVKMVLYAKGLTLLKNPDEATRKQLDKLRGRGVQIEVCGNSLVEQGVDFHTLYGVSDADIVPSGFAEVAYLQVRQHYAVDPVN